MADNDKTDNPENIETGEDQQAESRDDSPAGTADIENITAALADASPEPNDAAIGAHAEKEETIKAEHSHLRDAKGMRFDPALHVTDDSGQPKLTKTGKLRRRSGRKPGQTAEKIKGRVGGIGSLSAESDGALSAQQKAQARMAGEGAASALITLGVVLGGEEWHPITDDQHGIDEKAQLQGAFGDYFEAKEMTDIPPGVALTIAISAYALPRFTMPKTKSRLQRFKEWVAVKLAKRKVAKKGSDDGALADTRNDGKRQNDAG